MVHTCIIPDGDPANEHEGPHTVMDAEIVELGVVDRGRQKRCKVGGKDSERHNKPMRQDALLSAARKAAEAKKKAEEAAKEEEGVGLAGAVGGLGWGQPPASESQT